MFSRSSQNGESFFRFTSFLLTFVFVYLFGIMPFTTALAAAPQYKTFDERGKTQMENYFDRGKTLSTEATWQNFVDQGLGVSEAQWESEARASLDAEKKVIDETVGLDDAQKLAQKNAAQAVFDQAKLDWLSTAADRVISERGKWKAIVGNAFVAEVDEEKYRQIITKARTAVLGTDLNLALWDATVQGDNAAVETQFQSLLTAEINRIASTNLALSGTERTAFDAELAKVEASIKSEYELKQNYYLRRARNQYIAEKRSDLGSAKSESEKESAAYLTDQLLKQTWQSVDGMTTQALQQAVNAALGQQSADINNLGQDWQRQVEAIVSQGLKSWEVAEEDLMEKRIEWANKEKKLLKDGGEIWKAQYERIRLEKEKWMTQVKTQIQQGRALWDQKYVQFADERQRADSEFQRLLVSENDRWNGYNDKLIDMVTTGGSALSQAQDAVAFYSSVMPDTTDTTIKTFYQQQINYFNTALGTFNNLLARVRTEMQSTMLSQNPDSGYLVDKRVFAGTVPAEIAALGPSGFKSALQTKLDTFAEAYVLYDRDLRGEIQRADLYAVSSQYLGADLGAWFSGGYNFADVTAKLNSYSDEHANVKTDIQQIWNTINADNTNFPDEAAKKTALQTQVQSLLTSGLNVDQSLFNRVTAYFNTPYGGNYLTSNDNDPYLMTQAEYEWELLRNRRNFLAQQLATSEAVYNYARVANASGAGLELGQITKEAADIQKVYTDLAEIKYKILKGDIALNPLVKSNATTRDTEFTNILAARGIDLNTIYTREGQILTEKTALNTVVGAGAITVGTDLNALIGAFDQWRGTNPATPAGNAQNVHYLQQFSDKLIQLKNEWTVGLTGDALLEKQQRWAQLKSAAGALFQSLTDLQGNYRFSELSQKIADVKNAMVPANPLQMNLTELGAQLQADKSLIEAQALVVASAKAAFDQQQDIYRQTKKNFDVIALPNSQQIIATEISNMGQQLASVTNRMVFVNGVTTEMKDVVSASELDYYRILRERTEAQKDVSFTNKALQAIDNLKAARTQNAALDTMLTAGFATKSIAQIAQDFKAQEASLIQRTGSVVNWTKTIELFDGIEAQKNAYLAAQTALTTAVGGGNAATIAQKEKELLIATELLRQNIDGFIISLKMEKKINSEALDYLLDSQSTLGGQTALLNASALQKEVGDAVTRTNAQYDRLNEAAVNHLQGLISGVISGNAQATANSETLLKAVDDQIAQLLGGNTRSNTGNSWVSGSSYDFGLFEGKTDTTFNITLEKLWIVRAYLTDANVKARIDNLSSIPPPGGQTIEQKWQKYLEEVQFYQKKNEIFHDVTTQAPQSATDSWVTGFNNSRTTLRNQINTILGAGSATAVQTALTNYLNGLPTPEQADDARFIIQSYLGHYVNEGSTANLVADLTQVRDAMTQELSKLNLNYGSIWAKEQYLAKDREARKYETDLASKFTQIAAKNLEIQTIDGDIAQLNTLASTATALELTAINNEITQKTNAKTTLQNDINQLNIDAAGLRTTIDPLRAYASEILTRGSSLVMAPFVQDALWQYRIEEEGYRRLNSEWSGVKDASFRAEQSAAQQGLTDTIKQVIGFYEKDAYGNILRDSTGKPVLNANFVNTYLAGVTPAPTVDSDISVLLSGNQSGAALESWVSALTQYIDRAQAERKDVPDSLKQAIAGLESSLVEYLSAQAYIANRDSDVATINGNTAATRTLETERIKNIAKVLTLYQNVNDAMSKYNPSTGTSPLGAYTALVNELSKTQNKELLTLFSSAAVGPDAAVHDSLTELFALSDQLKQVREQLYSAQIQKQFLAARQTAYQQNKVLSVSEFLNGVSVLKTDALKTSISNAAADANLVNAVIGSLSQPGVSEIYASKLWDILSAFPANGDPVILKSNLLVALASDTFATQVRNELNALSPRDLYAAKGTAGASIDTFIAEQAVRADTFRTNFDAYVSGISAATTTASAAGMITTWMQNTANVPVMQQDYASEIVYLMQTLDQSMPLGQFKSQLTNFTALLANPSATEKQKFTDLTLQTELTDALNQYHYSANFNAAGYPAELRNFVLLRGYNDLNAAYQEFLRLKSSPIADEQNKAMLDLSGHPQEMQRHFYLNDFYTFLDAGGAAGGGQALVAYLNGGDNRDAAGFVAQYLNSRKIDASIVGSNLISEFTNIVLHARHGALGTNLNPSLANNQVDVKKEAKEFRTRLLMAKFDTYLQGHLNAGMDQTAFKTYFDAFLNDDAYKIGADELKDQLSGSVEIADFRSRAFIYYGANNAGNGNLNQFLPGLYAGVMSAATFASDARVNADSLLPTALTSITNYKLAGKGYINEITGTRADALKSIYLKQKLSENLALDPGVMTGAQIAQMVSTSGYMVNATVSTTLNTYFSDLSLAVKVAADSPSAALYNLRLTKAVETQFAGDTVAKEGLLANRANLSIVERASYELMDQSTPALRALANKAEAAFLMAAWEKTAGGTLSSASNTYYNGLSTAEKSLFDDYVLALGTRFSAQSSKFVSDYVPELTTYLTQSSALFNGDLTKSEATVRAAAEHLATPALRTAATQNFNEFYKAFAQYMQGSGSGVTLGAATVTAADFAKMAAELNTQEKGFFTAEQSRLTTFFNTLQEATAERTHVMRLMSDASLTNPVFASDVGYEIKVAETMAQANFTAITEAISQKLKNNQATTTSRGRVFNRNLAVADNLKHFAALRGDPSTTALAQGGSLFLDFRSFLQTLNDKQTGIYNKYVSNTQPSPTLNRPDYFQGKEIKQNILNGGSGYTGAELEAMFAAAGGNPANYAALLKSDASTSPADQVTYSDGSVSQTLYQQQVNKVNTVANSDLAIAYKEHLANNYLTALSSMNRSLASIFAMAEVTDAASATNGRQQIVAGLSGAITAFKSGGNIEDLKTAFTDVKQTRNARLLDDNATTGLSDNVLLGAQKQIEQNTAALRDSRQKLAEAAQRDVILGSNARNFLAQTFKSVSDDLNGYYDPVTGVLVTNGARQNYEATVADLEARKAAYATHFTYYTDALNAMAAGFKNFQVENSDYEKKAAVKDFATTAYLFASSTQASSANEADAYQMYLSAKQRYDQTQAQLVAKAEEVRTQDTLTQLSDLITKIDQGLPLTAQETAMRATYQNFIDARKEYVLESERMIRVKKAQEILNAEIEKRKAIAALKLAAYNKAKDDLIQPSDPLNKPLVYNRDKSIATFQAILASRGPGGLASVLKGMSWIDDTYSQDSKIWFNTYSRSDQSGLDEPAVDSDWRSAQADYNNLSPADKALLDEFRQRVKDGNLSSNNYAAFKSGADDFIRKKELYHESVIRLNWAWAVGGPMLVSGAIMFGAASGFFGSAAAAAASFFGAWAAPALAALGSMHWGWGAAFMAAGLGMIIPATIDNDNKTRDMNSSGDNVNSQRDQIVNKLNTIKRTEEEYLAAQAAVDYFTKAPSQQVLKDRLVQWGGQNTIVRQVLDPVSLQMVAVTEKIYTLSDIDLRYVKDDKQAYMASTGVAYTAGQQCPPTGNCANDAGRATNVTSLTEAPEFATAAGDLYDPSQITTQNLESTLQGGFYWLNGEKYVKIKQMNHVGQMTDTYAKYITAPIALGGAWDTYDLGRVLNLVSNDSDVLRAQLKQSYLNAGNAHEQTLMLNEREKTMDTIWDYADAEGKEFKGFQIMAGDYSENSTNVFQTQQQQNASLVTQQWDLRKAELDAARARWENLATTIESRGTESFGASEQKFLKAWRQWEIDTNRKIEAGKKQWDDKIKTFLVSKQNWQEEIKSAAMESSLERMLGATGSALNDRLRALSSDISIPVDVPEVNVTDLVQAAMADFERNKPSDQRIFGEINKSISAFNVTLELGNATHFKGFNSSTLEGDFASNMETFSKKMAILNNVKLYESMKKMIEDFKDGLRKNDDNVTTALTTAATLANYRESGGWYQKDMGWAFGGNYSFSAYAHADVDAIMNRGMKEAGMTIMSGEEMVNFLQNGRDVDVKLFFEVQTMALEQAFKIVGGDRSKKGLYGEWVGKAPEFDDEGDPKDHGFGELGGWTGGDMHNDKTYRGLHYEEKRLAAYQGGWNAAIGLTAGLAAAATGNVGVMLTIAAAQATASTGAAISSGRDVGGSLAMGAIDFGMAFGGAAVGGGIAGTAIRGAMGVVRAGIGQNADGSLNLDFKGNWSKGGGAQALFSGAMSFAGEALGSAAGGDWGKVISAGFDAIGDGMRFDSGGISGFSVASAAGSLASAWATNSINPGQTESKSTYSGEIRKQMLSSEIGKLANAVTTTLVGAMMNDSQATNNFISTYQNTNGFSAMGGILGRVVNMRMEENKAVDAARQAAKDGSGQMPQEMMGALARAVMRRKEEEAESSMGGAGGGAKAASGGGGSGGSAGVDDPVTIARNYFGKAKMDAENIGQINQMLKSGILSDADVKEISKQQVANNIEAGTNKALKLVPTKDFGGFMNTLAAQHKLTPAQVEALYVKANNPTLDPSDPAAYEVARAELKAKMSQGGTIAMPAGAGEYTSQTDKKYAPIRAQRAAEGQQRNGYANMAGVGGVDLSYLGLMRANMAFDADPKNAKYVAQRRAQAEADQVPLIQAEMRNEYVRSQALALGGNALAFAANFINMGAYGAAAAPTGGSTLGMAWASNVAASVALNNAGANIYNLYHAAKGDFDYMPSTGEAVAKGLIPNDYPKAQAAVAGAIDFSPGAPSAAQLVGALPGLAKGVSSWLNSARTTENLAYRALNSADDAALTAGVDLTAKAPKGTWTAAEHIANTGPGSGGAAANSPWISTTRSLEVAEAYQSGNGIAVINLNKVPSFQVELWKHAPATLNKGKEAIPFWRSLFSREVTIYQTIPKAAIKEVIRPK